MDRPSLFRVRPSLGIGSRRIKRAPAALFILVLGLLPGHAHGAGPEAPRITQGPTIKLEERRWDLGVLPQKTDADHVFRFSNIGTSELRILSVDTDCGCTAALAADSTLAPGQSSSITVTFSTKTYEGFQQKIIVLKTNDPAEPRIDLLITAEVRPFVEVDQRRLDFGKVRHGEAAARAALFATQSETKFSVGIPKGAEKWVTWSVKPAPAEKGASYRVEAKLRPDAPYGDFNERIMVPTTHPEAPSERIFVRGHVYSYFILDFPADKSRFEFPGLKMGKTATRAVKIHADGSKPYRITGVKSAARFLKPTLEEKGSDYLLTVVMTGEAGPKPVEEEIVLSTTDPAQPEMRVKVVGRFL